MAPGTLGVIELGLKAIGTPPHGEGGAAAAIIWLKENVSPKGSKRSNEIVYTGMVISSEVRSMAQGWSTGGDIGRFWQRQLRLGDHSRRHGSRLILRSGETDQRFMLCRCSLLGLQNHSRDSRLVSFEPPNDPRTLWLANPMSTPRHLFYSK
jgi:hypothetical protein